MTQENRNLLLKDLCGRLPYGVKVNHLLDTKPSDLFAIDTYRSTLYCFRNGREEWYKVEFIKPYLRPMSSITEKENLSLAEFVGVRVSARHGEIYFPNLSDNTACNWHKAFDWLNKNMFDYRGLIPKGLAEVAPKGMYNN